MKEEKTVEKKSKFVVWRNRALYFLGSIVLLFVLLSFLIQLPAVQNYVIDKITKSISSKIEEDVFVGRVHLSLTRGLGLDDFLIQSQAGDSLIYAKSLDVSLLRNLFSLLDNSLSIEHVKLHGIRVNAEVDAISGKNNLMILLDRLFAKSSNSTSEKEALSLDIRKVLLGDIEFTINDKQAQKLTTIASREVNIFIQSLDFKNKEFFLHDLELIDPKFAVHTYGPSLKVIDSIQPGNGVPHKPGARNTSEIIVSIEQFRVTNGTLSLDDQTIIPKSPGQFDAKHLTIDRINLDSGDLYYCQSEGISGRLSSLTAYDQTDFGIQEMSAGHFAIRNNGIELLNFNLKTPGSALGENIRLTYSSFDDLKELLTVPFLQATITESSVSLEELGYFLPAITTSAFYKQNKAEKVNLSGQYLGQLNNLKGSNVEIRIGNLLNMDGSFGFRNIQDPDLALINLQMNNLATDVATLKRYLPGLRLPPNFERLGKVRFKGSFDGYLSDFVAYGTLYSDLGSAIMDMHLDTKKGMDQAIFSGDLQLINFDLQRWTGNEELGNINFTSKIRNGKGLSLQNVYADLSGELQSFEFKGYRYANITLDGKIDKNNFIGVILSEDPNLDFNFQGSISQQDSVLQYNFRSEVGQIDFQALNLMKDKLIFRGYLDLNGTGNNVNDFVGDLFASNLYLLRQDSIHQIDSLTVNSLQVTPNSKRITIQAPDIKMEMEGAYDFTSLFEDLKGIIKKNYPYHTRAWDVTYKETTNRQRFSFDLDVDSVRTFLDLAGIKNVDLASLKAKGYLNSAKEELNFVTSIPELGLKSEKIYSLNVTLNSIKGNADVYINTDSSVISNNAFRAINVISEINQDSLTFTVNASGITDSIERLNLKGLLEPDEKGYKIRIINNDLKLFNQRWKINADNQFVFGKQYLSMENVSMTDGSRLIEIDDINGKGLLVNLFDVDIDILNPVIKMKKFQFGGRINSTLRISDIFHESPDISGEIILNNFTINRDPYGTLNLDIEKSVNGPFNGYLSLVNEGNGQEIKSNVLYDPDKKRLNANLKGKKIPLKILEYILVGGISNLEGYADVNATVEGKLSDLKLVGEGTAHQGKVKVNYLGERYSFTNQNFRISQSEIDLTGAVITDSQGNPAVIEGKFYHKMFKDFSIYMSLSGEHIIALNTTKYDNPVYYGFGKGRFSVNFSGFINSVNMVINAETRQGTRLSLPIKESQTAIDQSYVTFINAEEYFAEHIEKEVTRVKLEGISIEMNLIVTQDAQINLIFDESKGDVIKATGRGNLKVNMSQAGTLEMFGEYQIEEGDYLFTALGFVGKNFNVRRGGTIRWTGDPINALINIEADYAVRSSLNNFIAEYLSTAELQSLAKNRTLVNLKMRLGNTLFNPTIEFDFEFPELTGELKNYTDSKARLLRNNESDLNSQVFGLIVFNSFLPSNAVSSLTLQEAGSALNSTLSEFVSSQVSLFVTSIINEALEENGLISGVDFVLDLRNNSTIGLATADIGLSSNSILPAEIEIRLKTYFRFLDDRMSIDVGTNYVRESLFGEFNYIIPDFTLNYALTPDGKLNLRVYGKYDVDEININQGNRRQKVGAGLRYRTEFGSMMETKNDLSDYFAKELQAQRNEKASN